MKNKRWGFFNDTKLAEPLPAKPEQLATESLVKRWRFSPTDLTQSRRQTLLRLARTAIVSHLQTGSIPDYETNEPVLRRRAGAFVTLWKRVEPLEPGLPGGALYSLESESEDVTSVSSETSLRGCIGHVQADTPLCQIVQEMAVAAATADPRMPPMAMDELDAVKIEISVLSPLQLITDIHQIQIGTHGLMIVDGLRRGLLLPEVPQRLHWDREAFLANLYRKAGLSADCWPGSATLYMFTTVKFGEASG